jgi:hypothetical protein
MERIKQYVYGNVNRMFTRVKKDCAAVGWGNYSGSGGELAGSHQLCIAEHNNVN